MLSEVPTFLREQTVCSRNVYYSKSERTCVVLTRNLQCLEFNGHKQLLNSINLTNTCLAQVQDRLSAHNTAADSKDPRVPATLNATVSSTKPTDSEISFGKYVYTNFDICKWYLLIRCWDKLVVLQRQVSPNGFQVIAEYEKVTGYKLVHGKIKYQVALEIRFEDTPAQRTDFNSDDASAHAESKNIDKTEFKQLLGSMRSAKSELQVHRTITQKEFAHFRDTQTFGSNILRSLKLEEKNILGRCGDIWFRFIAEEFLVVGVPLIVGVTAPNLMTLKNVRPVLGSNSTDFRSVTYDYRFYQLKQRFEHLESLESFFQSEDAQLQADTWAENHARVLTPESYCVLLIKLRLTELLTVEKSPLVLLFEIEKNLPAPSGVENIRIFQQQLFLRNINFQSILKERQKYEITFQPLTLHQDLLAKAIMAFETKLTVKFISQRDLDVFESLLVTAYDFERIARHSCNEPNVSAPQCNMDIDDDGGQHQKVRFAHTIFYNRKPASMWYSLVVLKEAPLSDDPLKISWKFYNKNEATAVLMLKLLFDDTLSYKCNIEFVQHKNLPHNSLEQAIKFENALRLELSAYVEYLKHIGTRDLESKFEKLCQLQLQSDLIAINIKDT